MGSESVDEDVCSKAGEVGRRGLGGFRRCDDELRREVGKGCFVVF